MLRLLSHTKCDDANTTDGINKTTNTKLAQNVFQAKIKTAKKRSLRASEPPCSTHSKTGNLPTHTHTHTGIHEAKRTRARSLTQTLSTRVLTHTHTHTRIHAACSTEPHNSLLDMRVIHTRTHTVAQIYSPSWSPHTRTRNTVGERARALLREY